MTHDREWWAKRPLSERAQAVCDAWKKGVAHCPFDFALDLPAVAAPDDRVALLAATLHEKYGGKWEDELLAAQRYLHDFDLLALRAAHREAGA